MARRGGDPNRGLKVAFMQVPPFSLTEQLDALGEQLDAAVLQVLRSGQYIGGGVIAAFEQAFAKAGGKKQQTDQRHARNQRKGQQE